jgi:2-hydroxy-6-oxonona-2,4-dienedioate hydrolase
MSYWTEMLGGQVRYVRVGNVATRILEAGGGHDPLIVALHGAGGHAENFVTNIVPLSRAGHVVAPDLLGHGLSSRPPGTRYSLRAVIDHVKALIDTLDGRRVHVMGLSLGGMVAAHVTRELGSRVDKLVLVCPVGLAPDPASEAEFEKSVSNMVANNIAGFDDGEAAIRKKIKMLVHDEKDFPEEMITTRLVMYAQPGAKESMSAVLRDLGAGKRDYVVNARVLREIAADTLIIWGRRNFGSLAAIETASGIMPRGRVAIFEDSGHWPHVVERDKFHRVALDFLGDIGA